MRSRIWGLRLWFGVVWPAVDACTPRSGAIGQQQQHITAQEHVAQVAMMSLTGEILSVLPRSHTRVALEVSSRSLPAAPFYL